MSVRQQSVSRHLRRDDNVTIEIKRSLNFFSKQITLFKFNYFNFGNQNPFKIILESTKSLARYKKLNTNMNFVTKEYFFKLYQQNT